MLIGDAIVEAGGRKNLRIPSIAIVVSR